MQKVKVTFLPNLPLKLLMYTINKETIKICVNKKSSVANSTKEPSEPVVTKLVNGHFIFS